MKNIAYAVALLLAMIPMSCSLFGDETSDEFDRNRQRWERFNLRSYEYTLTIRCFCPNYGPLRVVVREDTVHHVNALQPDTLVSEIFPEVSLTIDDLFGIVEEAIDLKAYQLDVDYDATWNYPMRISIDYEKNTIDEEVVYRAEALTPLTEN